MEFLKALKQANEQGISAEQFLPVWQAEVKLRQQKEDVRLLELKMKLNKNVDPVIYEHFNKQKEEMAQLKAEMLMYNQAIMEVVKNMTSLMGPPMSVMNYGQQLYTSNTSNGINSDEFQFQHKSPVGAKADRTPGLTFQVENLSELLASHGERITPAHTQPGCPYSFSLSISFDASDNLTMSLIVTPLANVPLSKPISVCGKGYILNTSSKNYSLLWELSKDKDEACKCITTNQEFRIETKVALKTQSASFDVIKLKDLQERKFVVEDHLSIKWVVEPLEFNTDVTAAKKARVLITPVPATSFDMFPDIGDMFTVSNLSSLVSTGEKHKSQTFYVPFCPCAFYLNIYVTKEQELRVELVATRVAVDQTPSMKWPLSISSQGYILNSRSNDFTLMWEFASESVRILKKIKHGKERKFTGPLCLDTTGVQTATAKIEDLDNHNLINDNSFTVKWFVTVQGNQTPSNPREKKVAFKEASGEPAPENNSVHAGW